jgi:hypothetical protein
VVVEIVTLTANPASFTLGTLASTANFQGLLSEVVSFADSPERDVTHPSRTLTVSAPDPSILFYEEPIGEQGAGKQKSRRADSNR